MTQTPSSGAGATPPSDPPPAMGTTSGGATPPKVPTTLEEALARIAELDRHASNKAEEAARHGKNLTAAEKELAAFKEKERLAQEATLTETQKLQKEHADLQTQLEDMAAAQLESDVFRDVVRLSSKFNLKPNEFELVMRLMDWSQIEVDEESSKPTNVEKLLEKVKHDAPKLFEESTTPRAGGATNPGRNAANTAQLSWDIITKMTPEQYEARRQEIQAWMKTAPMKRW